VQRPIGTAFDGLSTSAGDVPARSSAHTSVIGRSELYFQDGASRIVQRAYVLRIGNVAVFAAYVMLTSWRQKRTASPPLAFSLANIKLSPGWYRDFGSLSTEAREEQQREKSKQDVSLHRCAFEEYLSDKLCADSNVTSSPFLVIRSGRMRPPQGRQPGWV